MKKKYIKPEIDILKWNLNDIITTSGDGIQGVDGSNSNDDLGWFDEFK